VGESSHLEDQREKGRIHLWGNLKHGGTQKQRYVTGASIHGGISLGERGRRRGGVKRVDRSNSDEEVKKLGSDRKLEDAFGVWR